jgi:hypothetical protein
MSAALPAALNGPVPRVLKPGRGNGGIGVQKVERISPPPVGKGSVVRVQNARLRDEATEDISFSDLLDRWSRHFDGERGTGRVIDQPFQPRISEGMIRCYFVEHEVVGFARQYPSHVPGADPGTRRIFGLPAEKTMFAPDEPTLRTLRERAESEWVPAMQTMLGVAPASLPVLWDADFLLGPRSPSGEDTYALCEINVSSIVPYPPLAPRKLAQATRAVLDSRGRTR